VVMSGHSTSDLIYKGKEQNNPRLFTNVYVKTGGRWQMVSHQVSDLAKT
jgi:SnoaL-like domain